LQSRICTPECPVESMRGRTATSEELALYFGNIKTRTVGIGLLINETEFTIDTDGRGESVFQNRLVSRLTPNLQSKVNSTMCTKTPHGYHRIFRYKAANDDEIVKAGTYWGMDGGHNEIALKGKNHYSIEYGPGYQEVRGIKSLVKLSHGEITELLEAMSLLRLEKNLAENIVRILRGYYNEPKRNNLTFAIAGFLHKARVPEEIIADIVERLAIAIKDEQLESRLQVVSNTCTRDPDSADVSGYQRRLEEIDGDGNALDKINSILQRSGYCANDGNDGNDANESVTKNQLALRLVEENVKKLFTDQFGDAYAAVKVRDSGIKIMNSLMHTTKISIH
jgi:ribosome-binding factor A